MPTITAPERVAASFVFRKIVWPHGRSYHMIETSQPYFAVHQPKVRDAAGRPMALTEEIGIGSMVQLALDSEGGVTAIKLVEAMIDDPFAEAAD